MTITLSWPVIAITIFVVASQIWAWTRDGACAYFAVSDRGFAVFFATIADIIFTAIVGGIWIW
jgi:hypothetical protein